DDTLTLPTTEVVRFSVLLLLLHHTEFWAVSRPELCSISPYIQRIAVCPLAGTILFSWLGALSQLLDIQATCERLAHKRNIS
ncbi:MAG: hypothetical protein ACUVTD_04435, partial [Nitrososphaerales archaeon]